MAIRKIVKDEEFLRKISKPVKIFNEKLHDLLNDMLETMREHDGMGLAAVQIGVLKRVIVIEVYNEVYEIINPEIISTSGSFSLVEGCLSVPGRAERVKRPKVTVIRGQDRYGNRFEMEGDDDLSRALNHEIDHLDGILYTDKIYHGREKKAGKK